MYLILCFVFLLSGYSYSDIGLYKHIDLSRNPVDDCRLSVGDLDGDGRIDFLFNDGRRLLKAFDHDGNLLWEKFNENDPGVEQRYHNFIISIYDIDLDSKNEVICFLELDGNHCLAILDGRTGYVETSTVLPFLAPRDHPRWGNDNYYMMNHTAVANLRGLEKPQDILAIHTSKQKVAAYAYNGGRLEQLWYWITDTDSYASGHYAYPYDIDDDGRDEVIAGVDVLNENGERLWRMELYPFSPSHPEWGMDHADAVTCADIDPDNPGKEIIVVAATGIWFYDQHGHVRWLYPSEKVEPKYGIMPGDGIQEVLVGHFRQDIPGLEMVCFSEIMYGEKSVALFDAKGTIRVWGDQDTGPNRLITYAMDWDGDRSLDEIYSRKGIFDGHFTRLSISMDWGYVETLDPNEFPPVVCDVQGDHREEVVWYDRDEIIIVYNTDPLNGEPLPSPWHALEYKLRYANNNHCNAVYFDWSSLLPSYLPPNPPTDLVSPSQTETRITLNWTAPIPANDGDVAAYYKIIRDRTFVGTSLSTKFIDTDLIPGREYTYDIYSVDKDSIQSLHAVRGRFKTRIYPDTVPPETPQKKENGYPR